MRGIIKIGSKDVEMLASAASPVLYKKVFREDWFKVLSETQDDDSGVDGIGRFEQMGFIMAMQASKSLSQLANIGYNEYLEWLEQFEAEALLEAVGDIANLYRGQEVTYSESKKEDG